MTARPTESVESFPLRYAGETRVTQAAPMVLETTVTVTNAGRAQVELAVSQYCPVGLRVYRIQSGAAGAQPVWDSLRRRCPGIRRRLFLEAGEVRRFDRLTPAADILGDSLPPGRYRLAAVLAVPRGRIELPTGAVDLK